MAFLKKTETWLCLIFLFPDAFLYKTSPLIAASSFFGGGSETKVWTQGFTLAKQLLYFFSHASITFFSGYLEYGVSQNIC
jgi:hypothetical protein